MNFVARRENLTAELVRSELPRGRMIIPANVHHLNLESEVENRTPRFKCDCFKTSLRLSHGG